MAEFKPNLYPIMYWALAFGVTAGIVLYMLKLLGDFITIVWVPVFLAGMAWGAYRNYKTQQAAWSKNNGVPITPQSPMNEFKQAFRDIRDSSQELLAQQQAMTPEPTLEEVPAEPEAEMTPAEIVEQTAPEASETPETIETIEEVPPTTPSSPEPPQPPQLPRI